MRLRTYIFLVALLVLLGLCTVHVVVRQTQAKYRMAELLRMEEDLAQDLKRLRDVEIARLRSPEHLKKIIREMNLNLEPLKPLPDLELAPLAYGSE